MWSANVVIWQLGHQTLIKTVLRAYTNPRTLSIQHLALYLHSYVVKRQKLVIKEVDMDDWEILPAYKHAKENKPAVYLVNRPGHSAEFKGHIAILAYIGQALYVEIFVNKARDTIRLIPVTKQSAYARNVTSDFKTHVRIGGGQLLREHFEMPFGKYVMTKPLTFKKA